MPSLRWRQTPAQVIPWFSGTVSSISISPSAPAEPTRSLRGELQHISAVVYQINLSTYVLSERTDTESAGQQLVTRPGTWRVLHQIPDCAAAVVAEEIRTSQAGYGASLVNKAADDCVPLGVVVFGNGQDQSCHIASDCRIEAMHAFHHIPAVVSAALRDVDFFVFVLTD